MKWLLGKERTRVSVFSEGGMSGGHAIEIRVESDIEREGTGSTG